METVEYHIGFSYFNYRIYLYALSHHQLWKTHDSVLVGKGISFIPLSSLMSITCIQVLTRDTLHSVWKYLLHLTFEQTLITGFSSFLEAFAKTVFSFPVWILLNWCPGFVWSYYFLCNIYFPSPVYCLFLAQFSFSWSWSFRSFLQEKGRWTGFLTGFSLYLPLQVQSCKYKQLSG